MEKVRIFGGDIGYQFADHSFGSSTFKKKIFDIKELSNNEISELKKIIYYRDMNLGKGAKKSKFPVNPHRVWVGKIKHKGNVFGVWSVNHNEADTLIRLQNKILKRTDWETYTTNKEMQK